MLSEAELAALRSELERSLPDTATVSRVTRSSDGQGGVTEDWATVGTYACRLSPATAGAERAIAERITVQAPWMVTLPAGSDVDERDRIAIAGRTFEVQAVLGARSYEVGRRVLCSEVE